MKKLPAILTLIIIALLPMSYSYAYKNGGININPKNNFDLAFTNVSTSDNEAEIDVATPYAQITPDQNTINIYILNAYPGYEAYIIYTIQNKGKIPARFDSLTTANPSPEALKITTTDNTGTWLHPSEAVEGAITVQILETAKENWQYTFQIKMGLSSQKEYPRTIGFWKQQFSTAIFQTESKQQIAPTTLEEYLNQITTQSNVFDFTGTQKEKFQQAQDILNLSGRTTMEAKLKAQLLALWLNYLAGWTEGYTLKGMTAYDIIKGSENALLNSLTSRYEYWKDLCDKFNNLGET